jgi:hypothetical protein
VPVLCLTLAGKGDEQELMDRLLYLIRRTSIPGLGWTRQLVAAVPVRRTVMQAVLEERPLLEMEAPVSEWGHRREVVDKSLDEEERPLLEMEAPVSGWGDR